MRWHRRLPGGFTFLELMIVTGIMMVLASAALPIVRVSMKRQREVEYRRTLREVRNAIDQFKIWCDSRRLADSEMVFGAECYPTSLDTLVQGVLLANDATGKRKKFLRRVPIDPITGTLDWGKRSYQDPPDTKVWGGQSVFDIYTKSEGKALDGSKYKDW